MGTLIYGYVWPPASALRAEVNEVFLFHGTSASAAEKILGELNDGPLEKPFPVLDMVLFVGHGEIYRP